MRKVKIMLCMAAMAGCFFGCHIYSMAGEASTSVSLQVEDTAATEGEYTMIRINAEDDGGGQLMYSIDSDAPEAFGTSSEFTVKKGSEHTVYVKDAAGNISAQVYRVPDTPMDIEVNIGYSSTSSAAMVTDEEREAIESGGGTVAERVLTDGSSEAERVFYTVTTKDEHVFYLMIDKSRGDNNVYLLDQVTDTDLYDLAKETGNGTEERSSIFSTNTGTNLLAESQNQTEPEKKKQGGSDWFLYAVLILLCAAAFYYYKIYKPKKKLNDVSDAMDLDEFGPDDDDEENDVMDFSVSQEEKDALLNQIIYNSDLADEGNFSDEILNYDPDSDFDMTEDKEKIIEELDLPEEEEDE